MICPRLRAARCRKGKPKGISKCGECPLHGIGLGFLGGTLVSLAGCGASPSAKAMSLPSDDGVVPGTNPCAHARHVGALADLAFRLLPDALQLKGLPVPTLETKYSVSLCNGMPTLDIGQGRSVELPGLDVPGAELCGQGLVLNF